MTSPESNHPPFYDEIFTGFVGLAASRGTINYDPLGPTTEFGDDGTLTPEGKQAFNYIYEVEGDELPQPVKEKGFDKIKVTSYTSQIYDGQVWPERVYIDVHEAVGINKHFMFKKEADEIAADDMSISDNSEEHKEIGKGLSDEEKDKIIVDMLQGDRHWLEQEGLAGEFARKTDFKLTFREGPPDVNEIDTLRMILAALR